MYTSVVGFPRVGKLRELKFTTEQYFRGEISARELEDCARQIRLSQWKQMQEQGVTFIPSNDFSFYDGVLDAAVLFHLIPEEYENLHLSPLDTYFAMARGYQGANGDVRALPMKKWFNTNYHYIVPELTDHTQIRLSGTKPFDEYLEAREAGIETKPVIPGIFTLLSLLRISGRRDREEVGAELACAYRQLLSRFDSLGARWIQFDEPALVRDLTEEDVRLFCRLYDSILPSKGNVRVLLQTYFGDIRDVYPRIVSLSFDGIGLDLVEGKESLRLLAQYGFPADKLLFAGVINGKNIWRNNYAKTLSLLDQLRAAGHQTVLGASCSLLHVPYTLENETRLAPEISAHFAFAAEKLQELRELQTLAESGERDSSPAYRANQALFTQDRGALDPAVARRTQAIREEDFTRIPAFAGREQLQKEEFRLPLFPTTTIGSFPQTSDVKANRAAYRKGTITRQEYETFNRGKIAGCIALQEEIGLDVLVHGEYERNDMVEYFGENLKGYLFTEKAWVQSYGTRCVKPPIIWGDISREKPITVDWAVYAQSLTGKPVKGMLTGPVTILNWSFPREDLSLQECAFQIALAIRDEVLDLEQNGIRIIQIDEAALREKLPLRRSDWHSDYLDWAIRAFRLVHSGVRPETQIHTHMCYSEFTDIIAEIDDMDADVITFEASRSDLQILDTLKETHFRTEVGPGVYDIHSPRVPSVEEIVLALRKMADKVDPHKLWVNPDCGLKTRGTPETTESLTHMVQAAALFRKEY
ncbi:MAG: 5-methyltetrahydropteroyltriglutamate--homocysteine S-methyltransferase [Eubacteriales bacterium]|nr:5-methyltetrahydropteroyltriglutamate--homocysteine S-methyltransferase [Eubacteriales bacterium]